MPIANKQRKHRTFLRTQMFYPTNQVLEERKCEYLLNKKEANLMNNSENDKKGMGNAYRIAQELLKDRLKEVNPEAYQELQDIKEADVIIIKGSYDYIENVLSMANTPHILVNPTEIERTSLRPDQVIFVNCPGKLSPLGLRKLKTFVSTGGFLFTTDWALKHVLEEAFPGYVRYNERATGDEVVRVEILDIDDPFLKSLLGPKDDPQWWLEGNSYPIQILDKEKVHVLVSSKEISLALMAKYDELGIKESNLGDVESAFTSVAMMNKIMFDKRKQKKQKKNEKQKK